MIREIYSFGFSFSDVDQPYIDKIAKTVQIENTNWYLVSYAWNNNLKHRTFLESLGFKVLLEYRW